MTATSQRRGRPSGTSPGEAEARLLDAAERLFGQQGFAATPVRAVGEAAGMNAAMVHYYFGSKMDLLVAVMDRALGPLADALKSFDAHQPAPLEAFLSLLHDVLSEHPALPGLIVREAMLSDGPVRDLFTERYAPRIGGVLAPLLARLQSEGRLHDSLDPRAMTVLIMALAIFPTVASPIVETVLGLRQDTQGRALIRDHAITLLDRGFTA